MRRAAAICVLLLMLSACSAGQDTRQPAPSWGEGMSDGWRRQAAESERICFDFVAGEMVTPQGGIRTNYLDSPHEAQYATGTEALSESSGLFMLYAAETGDEALFARLLGFVQEMLDTGGIIAYRYSEAAGAYHVNAFVDDIRIIRALLLADGTFGGEYLETALKYADRLYATNVKDGYMYDMYDESCGAANDFLTLCYADLYTIKLLARQDAKWRQVYDTALKTVLGGYISDSFPMYAVSYSYASGGYSGGEVSMTEAALTALNLAMVGECPQRTMEYLWNSVSKGALYGAYSRDGEALNDTQSTAIYAICALIAREAGDEEMYMTSVDRMRDFQVTDSDSEVYGAFADANTLELFSFDNLTGLLALKAGERT